MAEDGDEGTLCTYIGIVAQHAKRKDSELGRIGKVRTND